MPPLELLDPRLSPACVCPSYGRTDCNLRGELIIVVYFGLAYQPPDFQCAASEFDNLTLNITTNMYASYEQCHIKIFENDTGVQKLVKETVCTNGFQYSLAKDSTIVTEMDLVCDRANSAELLQTLVFGGQLVGAAFASSLSDRFGRKAVHLGSNLLTLTFGIGVAFSSNFLMLAILKFILGVLQQGMVMTGAVLSLELFPEKTRFYSEALASVFWTTGLVIMSAIAYLMRNYSWRYLQISLTCFSIFSLFQFWIQDESLRWLAINGKRKEANKIIKKVSRWNKVKYCDLSQIVDRKMAQTKDKCMTEDQPANVIIVEKFSIITILRKRSIFIISVMMWFTWVTNTMTYFGLTLTSTSLAGNRFLSFFLSACVEYIGVILQYLMLPCLGRRTITVVFHAITGLSLMIATILDHFSEGSSTLAHTSIIASYIGKMSITGSFSTLFLYTPELYPTNLRNVGIGISSTFSRIGAMLSPFAGALAREVAWAPGSIFSFMCFLVVILSLYLPETRGWDLPQTMAEVKMWYKENSGFRLRKTRPMTESTNL
ncbi:solute carrier family 22 member 16-like [Ostrea edulis]|uniref:solute carrier family 22 member 16-like n=1 Tax=Ostrea edulis TaxID=37623 RepID=UPI0024AEB917|nr:solute carrier family 22 member 16-like [Ostrea edulis]